MDELADEQKLFNTGKAKKGGKSPGEYLRDLLESKGKGGAKAEAWNKLDKIQKKQWHDRFNAAVKTIKATAPDDVQKIIKDSEAKGGGFRWDPVETEQLEAFAYTGLDWALHCGTQWVEAAEKDSASVYGNITHEMGGHNYYGDVHIGSNIQSGAVSQLDAKDQETAKKGNHNPFTIYGYMETEIFAELYEFTYATTGNPTDTPFEVDAKGTDLTSERNRRVGKNKDKPFRVGDVKDNLKQIKVSFAPTVAEGIVRGLWRRVQIDPRILDKAKELFVADVRAVFGFDLT